MAGGVVPTGTSNAARTEAPVTLKAYVMCAFAAFGGIFFGYDSGYISGVMGMDYFIHTIDGPDATVLESSKKSLSKSVPKHNAADVPPHPPEYNSERA